MLNTPLHVEPLTVGWCTVPAFALMPTLPDATAAQRTFAPPRRVATARCPALVLLVHHPREGPVLVDAGYAPRFAEVTRSWPERAYALTTPVTLPREQELPRQLAERGIAPRDVRHVVLTHLHADHVGALRDFPAATLHLTREAYEPFRALRAAPAGRLRATRAAFLPALLPDDFVARARWIERHDAQGVAGDGARTSVLRRVTDLLCASADDVAAPRGVSDVFGDGTLVSFDIPGHAPGMIALAMQTTRGPLLAVADAVWLADTLLPGARPHLIERRMAWSTRAAADTVRRLQRVRAEVPEWRLLPSHDALAIAAYAAAPATESAGPGEPHAKVRA